ncbi:MAG: isoprenylcysteine carboxylmethyltransferase family protein [Planctomycetes bacterium]|nr:isoprenylcysteine carboxylmethyltransferase family protein [Planctomycetota bacterium]
MSALLFRHRGVLVVLAILPATLLAGSDRGVPQLALALVLLSLGVALRLTGVRQIGSRARVHTAGARSLLTSGIFGYLRNPLYLGNAFVAVSACALLRSAECVPLVLLAWLAAYTVIAKHEERELRALFGAPYDQYCASVRRWIPRWSPYQPDPSEAPVSWADVLYTERLFVLGCAAIGIATALVLLGTPGLTGLRSDILEASPLAASGVVLGLATWQVLKINVVQPLKRAAKKRAKARRSKRGLTPS